MPNKRLPGREATKRLLAGLNTTDSTDELTCEEAQALLPALVEAQFAGESVDSNPNYAALLKHLDGCDACMELYVEMLQSFKALIGAEDILPPAPATSPAPLKPVRERPDFVLRVFSGLNRLFEFVLGLPDLSATLATLSGSRAGDSKREELLSERMPEVPGAPRVSVTLVMYSSTAELKVTIQEKPASSRWQIQLLLGDTVHLAKTDERGVATFLDLKTADLQNLSQMMITCVELE